MMYNIIGEYCFVRTYIIIQVSRSPGEYALSKDVDVSRWLDSRLNPLLNDTSDFVIIDRIIFKHTIPVNELLQFYCSQSLSLLKKVMKFGKLILN